MRILLLFAAGLITAALGMPNPNAWAQSTPDRLYHFSCDEQGWQTSPGSDTTLSWENRRLVQTAGADPVDPYLYGPPDPAPARQYVVAHFTVSGAPAGTHTGAVFAWVRTPGMSDDIILRKAFDYTNGEQTVIVDMSTGVEHITGDPAGNPIFGTPDAQVTYWRLDIPDEHNALPGQVLELDWTFVGADPNYTRPEEPCTEPRVDYDWNMGTGLYPPVPPAEREVGIAYTTWHRPGHWSPYRMWGTPLLGYYNSDQAPIIRQHGRWLAAAGVDFIWIDWSNNINYDPETMREFRDDFRMIEESTEVICEQFARMADAGEPHPRVSIFVGFPGQVDALTDGRLQTKVDQVHETFVANPRWRPILFDYLGKPLLVVYVGTPAPFHPEPPVWDDSRFTVRWLTGFVSEQGSLRTNDRVSESGYWAWEDRGPQTYTVHDGRPESMVALAAWRQQAWPGQTAYIPARGREDGATLRTEFARARAVGPRILMVQTWNEWVYGEQPSVEVSKDFEPSEAHGYFYLNLLAQEVARFKGQPLDASSRNWGVFE